MAEERTTQTLPIEEINQLTQTLVDTMADGTPKEIAKGLESQFVDRSTEHLYRKVTPTDQSESTEVYKYVKGEIESAFIPTRRDMKLSFPPTCYTQGNYTVPLSDTHPLAQIMCENNYTFNNFDIEYIGNGYYELESGGYYNILTNKITPDYPHFYSHYDEFFKVDEQGNTTLVATDYAFKHICDNIYLCHPYNAGMTYDGSGYLLADGNTNSVLIDFGEAKIGTNFGCYYHNGYFLATTANQSATAAYCSLYNSNGELAFEPVRMVNAIHDKIYELTDEGFVVKIDGIFYFYDYEGNSVAYDPQTDNTAMRGYSDGWALIMIERENWQYEYVFVNSKGESMF